MTIFVSGLQPKQSKSVSKGMWRSLGVHHISFCLCSEMPFWSYFSWLLWHRECIPILSKVSCKSLSQFRNIVSFDLGVRLLSEEFHLMESFFPSSLLLPLPLFFRKVTGTVLITIGTSVTVPWSTSQPARVYRMETRRKAFYSTCKNWLDAAASIEILKSFLRYKISFMEALF